MVKPIHYKLPASIFLRYSILLSNSGGMDEFNFCKINLYVSSCILLVFAASAACSYDRFRSVVSCFFRYTLPIKKKITMVPAVKNSTKNSTGKRSFNFVKLYAISIKFVNANNGATRPHACLKS